MPYSFSLWAWHKKKKKKKPQEHTFGYERLGALGSGFGIGKEDMCT